MSDKVKGVENDPVREKLFDLMMRDPCPYPVVCSARCEYYKSQHCHAERYTDHLIANGVTVQEWISVKDRLPTAEDSLTDGSVYAYTKAKKVLVLHYQYVCRRSDYILCWMPIAMPQPPNEVKQ